jgi:hypothetical protein
MSPERRWFISQRWLELEGEGRTNVLRVLAVAAYYAVHLMGYLGSAEQNAGLALFHNRVTEISFCWLILSLLVLVCLQRHYFPAGLKYFTAVVDTLLVTVLASLGNGPESPIVLAYFLILATAALRFSLRLVWTTTFATALGYLVLVGKKDPIWFDENHTTPVVTQLITLLSLGLTGLCLGQIIRRVRALVLKLATAEAQA